MSDMKTKLKSFLGFGEYDEYDEEFDDLDELEDEDGLEEAIEPVIQNKKNNKVVNIHTSSSAKVTITKPVAYEEATEICDALKNRRIVLTKNILILVLFIPVIFFS